jgi:glycosyltransferase involved in cell wall biosynthesis
MRVAYIVGCFPFINITFIYREIVSMRRQGLQVDVVAMLRPKEGYVLEEARHEMETTFYFKPIDWSIFIIAHLFYILTHPYTYFHSVMHLATRPHSQLLLRLKTIAHFAIGPYVAWYFRKQKPQHIHAHFADRATVVAYVTARLLGVEHSFTAHAKDIYAENVFLADKIKTAKFVSTCTAYNFDYLRSLTDEPEKIHLLYHGLDFSEFKNLERRPKLDSPLILSIGKLKEKKGFCYLIDACALLRDQGQNFCCWIIGEGPDRNALLDQIKQLGLQHHVYLKGNMSHSNVLEALNQATLFSLPSVVAANNDRDGIPNVILEAMAVGVPVVSTSISAIPEVVIQNETGYLVASRDSRQLADSLTKLLNSSEERARLAQNAKAFVQKNFQVDRNVKGLKLLFEQQLQPGARIVTPKNANGG